MLNQIKFKLWLENDGTESIVETLCTEILNDKDINLNLLYLRDHLQDDLNNYVKAEYVQKIINSEGNLYYDMRAMCQNGIRGFLTPWSLHYYDQYKRNILNPELRFATTIDSEVFMGVMPFKKSIVDEAIRRQMGVEQMLEGKYKANDFDFNSEYFLTNLKTDRDITSDDVRAVVNKLNSEFVDRKNRLISHDIEDYTIIKKLVG